ncbi:MAG: hypothetical protein ABI390_03635 [Daejeonella sp.]
MNSDNTEINLEIEAPLLSAIGKSNPFCVPENYFKTSSERINDSILLEKLRFVDTDEFQIPENYFENLSARINSSISVDALKLNNDRDGFSVPENYFAQLNSKINSRISAEVVSEKSKIRTLIPNWTKYAAAACITLVVASVGFYNMKQNPLDKQLGQIPDQVIINYLETHSDVGDTPAILENLGQNVNLADMNTEISQEDLQYYIDSTL